MLESLKIELEEAAFLVAKDADPKDIHAKIVNCLAMLNQIENGATVGSRTQGEIQASEVNKVSRRLKMWVKRQNQYNSKILNAYLDIRRAGNVHITESDIDSKLGPNTWFASNISQMKSIADKNHGKVFHQVGDYLEIWEPVKKAVTEYESNVYRLHNNNL